ncbi:beta-N-acetylglucosaminidase [Mobilisporobacter senegalensis]|uniref:Beta-N-acetylglucosaminidase n=1 Tax=Mobilisporobacter senegalensis TaxID=1329262 RepID=A0A3N1XI91_9FIRM|nr:cadherin-like beta sandwich domain-containing protein [Mobilisporobacter senegalensis]ROR26436.1 beta-N-acetylglucosaminidase [Mobilisporobacter senegalensis]
MKKRNHILFTMLMCFVMAFPSITPLQRNNIVQASAITASTGVSIPGIVTASSLKVRSKADKTGAQLKISGKYVSLIKNTKVTILKEVIVDGEKWYYISAKWNGTTIKGYVSSDYIKLSLSSKVPALVNSNSKIQIRTGAGDNKPYLKVGNTIVALKTTTLYITGEVTAGGAKWYKVSFKFEGKTRSGYIKAIDTKFKGTTSVKTQEDTSTASYVTSASNYSVPGIVNATSLNVRTKASRTGPQLKSGSKNVAIKNKTKITIIKEVIVSNEKWYYISFKFDKKTVKGYVLSDYIKIATTKIPAAVNSKKNISIRTGASDKKSYLKVSGKTVSLKPGTELAVISEYMTSGVKWFKVTFKYSGKTTTGYIKAMDVIFKKKEEVKEPVDNTPKPEDNETTPEKPVDNNDTVKIGKVTASSLRVRSGSGTSYAQVYDAANQPISLSSGHEVTIKSEIAIGSTLWYEVSFKYGNATYDGYVSGDYIRIVETPNVPENPGTTIPEIPNDGDNTGNPPILSDAEFEAAMINQGFPESYKPYLRALHAEHPYWQFEAYQTGLDWETVIANQNKIGKNLITNSKNIAWKSLATGAYNWKTDQFIPYDGSTWVTASKEAIEYYMDPRNFLTSSEIFQFELLSYQKAYQTKEGVENILLNTALYGTSYTYINDAAEEIATTYGDTFIKAAEVSMVSPYHLATRVKQEVVTGRTTLSSSVTGKVSGYEGYYNFFNIGATHSTVPGGAVANGLNYAKNGSGNAATNALYMIPWDSPFKSIVGGSNFIGASYINRGQNTVYLQKFNVTPVSTHSHQYMANVEAARAESAKTYAGYSAMTDIPIVFKIPVYINMPENVCPQPATALNPNNWLKSLSVDGYKLTPTFKIEDLEGTLYSLIVPGKIEGVNVSAAAVSTKASVSGTGYVPLSIGNNPVTITVTAENQAVRQYTINIVRDMSVQ